MMLTTPNLGLKKPEGTDVVDIQNFNDNADVLDAAIAGKVSHSLATAANDFLVASGVGQFVKKTLAEVKAILGLGSAAYTDSSAYATAAQGTTAVNTAANLAAHVSDYVLQPANGGTTGGTSTAYTCSSNPAPTALVDKIGVVITAHADSGSNPTLNWSSLGAKPIKKPNGNAAVLKAGGIYTLRYNATSGNFILQGEGASGNATASDLLSGKTASTDAGDIIGAMPNIGSVGTQNLTIEGGEYTIPAGYHNGLGKVKAAISNIGAAVIKAGVNVGGITGTFTADATASAAQILSGYSAYVNSAKIDGNMVNNGAVNLTASFASDTPIPQGYHNGSGMVKPPVFTAGSATELSPYASSTTTTSAKTMTKLYGLTVAISGTYRITFQMGFPDGWNMYSDCTGQIYKNGVPYGTLRSNTAQYLYGYTEDLYFEKGDIIGFYAKIGDDDVWPCRFGNISVKVAQNFMMAAG